MATLTWVDSFDHQVATTSSPLAAGKLFYDFVTRTAGTSFDTTNKRTGTASLQLVEDGTTATNVGKTISSTAVVLSFYIRVASDPSVKSQFFHTIGATVNGLVGVNTNGTVFANIGGVGEQTGPDITDGNWHRIDVRYVSTQPTYTLDVSVDGTALTQVTSSQGANSTITSWRIGSNTTSHTMTFQVDDLVVSLTSGDHPIGPHRVESKLPVDDSADSVYGTNVMEQGDGTDLSSSNKGYQYLNEWPPTTGTNNADTVTQAANGTGNWVEVEFDNVSLGAGESLLGVVMGRAAIQSDGTAANNGTTRFVDGSNTTLLDIFSGDMSVTTPEYLAQLIPAPGGTWDTTEVNAIACRVGLSSDAAPDPEWLALMIEVPIQETNDQTVSPALLQSLGATFSPRVDLSLTPGLISQVGVTFAPSMARGANPDLIQSLGVVFAPTRIDLEVTPGLISQVGVTFEPTVSSGLQVSPDLIAQVGVTFSPQVNLQVTPGLISQVGTTFAPQVNLSVTPGLISQVGVTFAPQVNLSVTPGLISQVGVTFAPTTTQQVTPGLVQSLGVTFAPQVNLSVTPGLIQSLGTTFAPTLRWEKNNTFEGGSDETGITTGNSGGSSGDAFDAISIGAGGSLVFDSAHQYGSFAMRVINGTNQNAYAEWNLGSIATSYNQFLVEIAATPTGNPNLVQFRSGGALAGGVRLTSAGRISIHDSAGTQQGISTMSLSTSQLYRIEVTFTGHASAGAITVNIYSSPSDATSDETVIATGLNTTGLLDLVRWGATNNPATSETYWLDSINTNNYAILGPLLAQVTPGLIQQVGVVFAPTLQQEQSLTPGLIQSLGTTFAPQVNLQVSLGLISQVGVAFAPVVVSGQTVTVGLISQLAQVFAPTVTITVVASVTGELVMTERALATVQAVEFALGAVAPLDRRLYAVESGDHVRRSV